MRETMYQGVSAMHGGMPAPMQEADRPHGLSQHMEVAFGNLGRAQELTDMILQHVNGPCPKEDNNKPSVSCLISMAVAQSDSAQLLCKKLETILQLLGR